MRRTGFTCRKRLAILLLATLPAAIAAEQLFGNPTLRVPVSHAPGLGLQVQKVAFAEGSGQGATEFTEQLIARFVSQNVEVLERGELTAGARLFARILVPLSGEDASWTALEQAILVAKRERSELRGVHVLAAGESKSNRKVQKIKREFERRIQAAGLPGRLVLEKGNISNSVERRAHWSDLVVLHLKHPPGTQLMQRLLSGLRNFLQRTPRPVVVVPRASKMKHALLAYDGSRKASEALYLTAYLASNWGIKLTVFTSLEKGVRESLNLQKAKSYLIAQKANAEYVQRRGRAVDALLKVAKERGCDFILIGGYSQNALIEVMLGSTLDQVLREFHGPVWICT